MPTNCKQWDRLATKDCSLIHMICVRCLDLVWLNLRLFSNKERQTAIASRRRILGAISPQPRTLEPFVALPCTQVITHMYQTNLNLTACNNATILWTAPILYGIPVLQSRPSAFWHQILTSHNHRHHVVISQYPLRSTLHDSYISINITIFPDRFQPTFNQPT